jgi:isoquinoline 1-oxidoreductase alpha subunit
VAQSTFTLLVNGSNHQVMAESDEPLLWVLRDQLRLTGTKFGCGEGICGACLVIIDNQASNSCLLPVSAAIGKNIETIEGLGQPGRLSPLQDAFKKFTAFGCGFCSPGQIVRATILLRQDPNANREKIIEAMDGNLCRCAAYPNILAAVEHVARSDGSKT